jgi:hypothetical protein
MASHTIPDPIDMNSNAKTWLQLYVDAMTEKDPYKRLALVQELRKLPRHDDSEDMTSEPVIRPSKRARVTRRRH